MKVSVRKKGTEIAIPIHTECIKLQDAMKLANLVATGGEAKTWVQEGEVEVNGEVCTMRGRKLYPGDTFRFQNQIFRISGEA